MEFLLKYLNKYCLIIGRILLNTVQELTFLKAPVKAVKGCIQEFCFPRQSCQTLLECSLHYFLLNSFLLHINQK